PSRAAQGGMGQRSRGGRRSPDRPPRGVGRWVLLSWCRVCLRCLARRRCDWALVVRRTGLCAAPDLAAGSGSTGTTVLVGRTSPRRRPTFVSAVAGGVGGLHANAPPGRHSARLLPGLFLVCHTDARGGRDR